MSFLGKFGMQSEARVALTKKEQFKDKLMIYSKVRSKLLKGSKLISKMISMTNKKTL
jgi:hypothetical protein